MCREPCLVPEIHPRSRGPEAGFGEAPGGRYVGQQHASLTAPMGRFAKSSSSTIRVRSNAGVEQRQNPPDAATKTATMTTINNGYQTRPGGELILPAGFLELRSREF